MGMTSDMEIVSAIGSEPEVQNLIAPSLEEAAALGIYSQQQALDYIGGRIKAKRPAGMGMGRSVSSACSSSSGRDGDASCGSTSGG